MTGGTRGPAAEDAPSANALSSTNAVHASGKSGESDEFAIRLNRAELLAVYRLLRSLDPEPGSALFGAFMKCEKPVFAFADTEELEGEPK